jgi:hypothetical protein
VARRPLEREPIYPDGGRRTTQLMRDSLGSYRSKGQVVRPITAFIALLLLFSPPLCSQVWQPLREPPFARYEVTDSFAGPPAPVDLRSNPRAHRFRTILREKAAKGPNFAGHYTIAFWNCGHTDCATVVIIDAQTGRVYFAPFEIESQIHYQRSSRLLLVDPRISCATEAQVPGARTQRWYVWNDTSLVLLDRVPMHETRVR